MRYGSTAGRRLGFESLEGRRMLAVVPDGFTETAVATGLTSPITMDIDATGRIWLAYQDGRIEVIEDDQLLPGPVITLDADGSGERGLQGIELDPDFETNHFLYVYYTAASPQSHNRLSRLTVDSTTGNTIVPGSELVLLDLPNFSTLPQNQNPPWHMGGAIHFMADGSLVIQIGDHLNNTLVQNLDQPLGKILRVNKDGTPAQDNPYYNAGDGIGWRDYVWAAGLRNPYSGDVDPATGRYFVNDVGEGAWEEINDATLPGRNFGWPTTEGGFNPATYPNFTQPFYAYSHSQDAAITGGAFNSPLVNQFPIELQGKYFFSQFTAGRILVIDPDNPGDIQTFATGAPFPMNIEFGPDGSMYYIARGAGAGGAPGTGTGQVLKVQYALNTAPQVVIDPTDALVSVGYDAVFSVSAAGTAPLSYQWQRDSGSGFVDIPNAQSAQYVLPGASLADDGAQFRVVVSNPFGMETSAVAVLDVTTDTPPSADILLPTAELTYRGGDVVTFAGVASDLEDGPLSGASMTWQVDFHHDDHLHPFFPATPGITGGQFQIPASGEVSANVWYRIHLTVTDSAGLTTESIRDIFPEKTDFTVVANIDGAPIAIDGQPAPTPHYITGVENIQRSLEAPLVVSQNGQTGRFVQWLDGETQRLRNIDTPQDDRAYVALYERFVPSLIFVSDLTPSNDPPPNGWGPIEYDTSNGEDVGGDGVPMSIGGVHYEKGLGVHAFSDLRYDLAGDYTRFIADVGVDDETGNGGSVQFRVYGDGDLLYESGVRTGGGAASLRERIDIGVAGVNELRLTVTDGGNGNGADHADWADARLVPVGAGQKLSVNFQPSGSPAVPGFSLDNGQVYGPRGGGQSYGWSTSHTGAMVDRNSGFADDILETHVEALANQYWEIALPNGDYSVTVSVGDAGGAGDNTVNTVNVEGVPYWSGLALGNDEFAVKTELVTVADGRLRIDVGASATTAINFVEIIALPAPQVSGLYPFFAADVDLDGRLDLDDVVAFGAGWGSDGTSLTLEQRVRAGDLDMDGDTDAADWAIFNARWNAQGNDPLNFASVIANLPGDYNRSGFVSQADYDIWRGSFGSTTSLAADGNGDGRVDAADYTTWRDHLGDSIGQPVEYNAFVLIIHPTTGESRLWNDTDNPIDLVGYSINSTDASLLPGDGQWNSLQDQATAGWQEAAPTASALSELSAGAPLTLLPGASIAVGRPLDLTPPQSGLTLEYVRATDTGTQLGVVVFSEYVPTAVAAALAAALAHDEAFAAPSDQQSAPAISAEAFARFAAGDDGSTATPTRRHGPAAPTLSRGGWERRPSDLSLVVGPGRRVDASWDADVTAADHAFADIGAESSGAGRRFRDEAPMSARLVLPVRREI